MPESFGPRCSTVRMAVATTAEGPRRPPLDALRMAEIRPILDRQTRYGPREVYPTSHALAFVFAAKQAIFRAGWQVP